MELWILLLADRLRAHTPEGQFVAVEVLNEREAADQHGGDDDTPAGVRPDRREEHDIEGKQEEHRHAHPGAEAPVGFPLHGRKYVLDDIKASYID